MNLYPTITWVSVATPGYEGDLARLTASTRHLGADHRFIFHRTARNELWYLTRKFEFLRRGFDNCRTTHLFWIDADCEIVAPFTARDIAGTKPLTAVRHFGSTGPKNYLPPKYHARLGNTGAISWQSCLFGGTVDAMAAQLERLQWMDAEGETYDEHGLVIDWSQRVDDVLTLPCRWVAPTCFDKFPVEYRARFNERAEGLPVVVHHNRALNPGQARG